MGWIQSSLQAMINNQQAMAMGGMPIHGTPGGSIGGSTEQRPPPQVWSQNQPHPPTSGPPFLAQSHPGPSQGIKNTVSVAHT
jgi:hypothetical protein